MRDSEVKHCKKCGAELHPEFVVPVAVGHEYFCPKCSKELKELLGIKEMKDE